MAVDTAAKRYSMITVGGERFGMRVPTATDMDDAADRQNELFLYSGLEAEAPPAITGRDDRRRRSSYIRHGKKRS
jgi:hypothetical protein